MSSDDVLALARGLIESGRLEDAQALLDGLASNQAGGVERDFLGAIIALIHRNYRRAELTFRTILARDPNLIRVRLELARTLFLENKDEEADYHFKLATAQRPATAVITNIARFREAIRARRAWRFNVEFGLAPDSNVNSATDKERVDILGLPFQLDPSARAQSGVGMISGGDASLRIFRGGRVPVYLAGYGRMVRYTDHGFDDIYVGGEAGPEVRVSGGRLRVAMSGLKRWYGGRPLVVSVGPRLNFDKIVRGKWALEASLTARRNDYAGRDDVDGWDIEGALSVNLALGASALGFAYSSLQRSIARDHGQANWQGRIGFGVLKEVGWGLRPQVAIAAGRQINDAPLVLFGETRSDWRLQASASIYKRDWSVAGFAPSLRVSWARNISTIALYDQQRIRAEFGIAKAF